MARFILLFVETVIRHLLNPSLKSLGDSTLIVDPIGCGSILVRDFYIAKI